MQLDYKDVLLRPKRSTLKSRSEVDLNRSFRFRSGREWTGVPLIVDEAHGAHIEFLPATAPLPPDWPRSSRARCSRS